MLDTTKHQNNEIYLRKNKIETYDNLIMKTDSPTYEGSFYDVINSKMMNYPLDVPLFKDILFSETIILGN